jgi:hypothetical protein
MFRTAQVASDFVYEFVGGAAGTFNAKTVNSGVYSSSASSDFLVQASVLPTIAAPTLITSSPVSVGQTVSLSSTSSGSVYIYKDAAYVGEFPIASGNFSYIPLSTGSYTFKVFRDGVLSSASGALVVNSGSTDCSAFVNDFTLGTIFGKTLKVYDVNGYKVIKEVIDANKSSLKNANYLKLDSVTSSYKAYTSCFGFPNDNFTTALTQSNIGSVSGYVWNVSQDGLNTPILVLNTSLSDVYRIAGFTECAGKRLLFAYSSTVSNPSLLSDSAYSAPDGVIKLNSLGEEDANGVEHFYKLFNIPAGAYNFFFKVEGSTNTPVKVVNRVIN